MKKFGDFVVPEFFPEFVGRGSSLNEAFLDWRNDVHRRFQDLYSKRPFEMTGPEKAVWQLLESQINVNAYRTTTKARQAEAAASKEDPETYRLQKLVEVAKSYAERWDGKLPTTILGSVPKVLMSLPATSSK
jgi:hypothetical protein